MQAPFVAHNKYGPQNRLLRGNINEVDFNTQQDNVVPLSEQTKSCSAGISPDVRMLFANENID